MPKFLKLFVLFIIVFFTSCTNLRFYNVKTSGVLYQGKLWWKLVVIQNKKKKVNGGYAWFCTSPEFLVVELKTPFNSELAVVSWKRKNPNKVILYDLFHKRKVTFLIHNKKLKNLPLYFLGKKGEKVSFSLFKKPVLYTFLKGKGEIKGENFDIVWKFKSIKQSKECKVPLPETKDFKELVLTF